MWSMRTWRGPATGSLKTPVRTILTCQGTSFGTPGAHGGRRATLTRLAGTSSSCSHLCCSWILAELDRADLPSAVLARRPPEDDCVVVRGPTGCFVVSHGCLHLSRNAVSRSLPRCPRGCA